MAGCSSGQQAGPWPTNAAPDRQPRYQELGGDGLQRRERLRQVLQALSNAKVAAPNMVGVGLGGYLACKSWGVGADAVATLVARVRGGEPASHAALGPWPPDPDRGRSHLAAHHPEVHLSRP